MVVTFMTAEKWVVPDPILYELLSLPHNTEYEVFPFSGIYLIPIFVCLQTKLLCYHSIGNTNGMAEILTLMNSFITENTFTTKQVIYTSTCLHTVRSRPDTTDNPLNLYYNLYAFFPSMYNTASGYLQILLQILNYLSI